MLDVKHVCTDCGHRQVCTLQKDYMGQIEVIIKNKGEDYFLINVSCKHFISSRQTRSL